MLKFELGDVLVLKEMEEADAPELFSLVDRNREYLREWLPWLDRNTNVEHSKNFIRSIQPGHRDDGGFICGVYFDSCLVGICGFHPVSEINNSVSIGYWLTQEKQGYGIITRCTKFFIDYAFNTLGLNKVVISVAVGNTKSRAVCERLGLKEEGIDRQGEFLYGKYVDLVRYSILKSEWSA